MQELACQLDEARSSIQCAAQDGCDALLRVSAGIGAVLRLLEADGDLSAPGHEVHCLLAPLKAQLDVAVNRVQAML